MIDTHAHILLEDLDEFDNSLDSVILAGTDLGDSLANLELSKRNDLFKAAVGIHPENIPKLSDNWIENFEKMIVACKEQIVAIGECGLDINCNDAVLQEDVFRKQIELALNYDLPLIIHSRKYNDECIEILGEYKGVRGVFHCYTGGKKRVNKILGLGDWYFGVDGNITYEEGLAEVIKAIPKNRLLAETDSPFLTPMPFRGEKNKPSYVRYVYQKVAEIWRDLPDTTEKLLDNNAKKLFRI